MQFDISNFRKYVETVKVLLNPTSITGILHEDLCTFMIVSRRILLRMSNVSGRSFGERTIVLFMSVENYMVEADRSQSTIKYGSLRLEIHAQNM